MTIDWAARWMPVLAEISGRITGLEDVKVGVSLVLEPKTVNLALALHRAGAMVALRAPAAETIASAADAAREAGLAVYAGPDSDDKFLRWGPQILLDDGAAMISRLHTHHPELIGNVWGAAEETTSGVRPLRAMAGQGQLKIPVFAVNDAPVKYLFDNVYGTAQSCLMTFLDVTNLQLAGRDCLVIGYGWVGRGLARYLAGFGARVTVSEIDPVKALQALHDGHRVAAFAGSAPRAEVIFTATGLRGTITPEQLRLVKDGVFLAVAGGEHDEIPMTYLHSLGTGRTVRPDVQAFTLKDGKTVKTIADGECINVAAAEGNPIEIMDLSLSLQALAVREIAARTHQRPGVYPLPDNLVREVAELRLKAAGATLEPLTDDLARAMTEW